ncbi:MAG: hypothetical protein K9J37_11695 [Saprospiraceae bacterium]|nr:hypothetical protein [Saprospiraceae bacterium]MCF8250570.1 hypothetical protein [Saprospiraceae bacterium]MCF8282800.1 hypothetical protein [Bacteroidales bacterium]MCF8313111.1 hypothetical protein [Saprospiraceae bacterium]MCF8441525.1 hypothetical protein [Saprospiraceae bacterium]
MTYNGDFGFQQVAVGEGEKVSVENEVLFALFNSNLNKNDIVNKIENEGLYKLMRDVVRIGNQAVMQAKEENKRFGIPEFFSKNGVIYYVMENGDLTTERPDILKDKK